MIIHTAPPASLPAVAVPVGAICNRDGNDAELQRGPIAAASRSHGEQRSVGLPCSDQALNDQAIKLASIRSFAGLLMSLLLGLSLNLMTSIASADYPLTIIELKHRLPEDLIPVLAPLAGPDGVVTGANASLFVRASPNRLADIRAALARLDQAARNLLVEVRRRSAGDSSNSSFAVTVDEPIGKHGRLRVGPDRQTGIRAGAGRQSNSRDLLQQVRVMDGGQAFIRVGSERPVGYREIYIGPDGRRVQSGIGYVNADDGFYVRPRLSGDRVVVDISTSAADFDRRGGIDTGAVDTRVSGQLGEWIPFGASQDSAERQGSGLTHRSSAAGSEIRDLELRVRTID
jgi:hypothetical protein